MISYVLVGKTKFPLDLALQRSFVALDIRSLSLWSEILISISFYYRCDLEQVT